MRSVHRRERPPGRGAHVHPVARFVHPGFAARAVDATPWCSTISSVAAVTPESIQREEQQPRDIARTVTRGDRIFRTLCASAAAVSLLIIGGTAIFLAIKAAPALREAGLKDFFTTSVWNPTVSEYGVLGLLVGTVIIASVALAVAVPLALGLALFINEYAPSGVRRTLTSAVDLLAAMPSIIFGMWGLYALQDHLVGIATWLNVHLDSLPFFRLSEPDASLLKSSFITGSVVALMIVPIITSVSRDVMAQCPRSQCEAALALGGSRWGMIREVLLPFGKGGIVGAVLLGFGRALGETIAITLLIAFIVEPNSRILETGGGSIASLIAIKFPEAQNAEISALIAAGLALFAMTLVVNLGARAIVRRTQIAV
jgi:phosphate transport system permease protein